MVMVYGWFMVELMIEIILFWGCKNFIKRWWMINCFFMLYGFVLGVKNWWVRKEKKIVGVIKRIINEWKGLYYFCELNMGYGIERRML